MKNLNKAFLFIILVIAAIFGLSRMAQAQTDSCNYGYLQSSAKSFPFKPDNTCSNLLSYSPSEGAEVYYLRKVAIFSAGGDSCNYNYLANGAKSFPFYPDGTCSSLEPYDPAEGAIVYYLRLLSTKSGGSGTVTSVGLTGTGISNAFSVSGSPITTAGTFTVSATHSTGFLYNNNGNILLKTNVDTQYCATIPCPAFLGEPGQVLTLTGTGGTSAWENIPAVPSYVKDSAWLLTGNSGTTFGTNYIGTNDSTKLEFKVNNQIAGYLGFGSSYFGNTAFGYWALRPLSTGTMNTAVGSQALNANTTGTSNSAFGFEALHSGANGFYNSAFGVYCFPSGVSEWCTGIGYEAGYYSSGKGETFLGVFAGLGNTTGNFNINVGDSSGYNITTGYYNINIGGKTLATGASVHNENVIGWGTEGNGNNTTTLANSSGLYSNGSLNITGTGNGLIIPAGSNCRAGTATLTGGTVTVTNTAVTASSIIFISYNSPEAAPGAISAPVGSISAGVHFVINSTDITDNTSTVNWWILN